MKIVRDNEAKAVEFEDLKEGDVFREVGEDQLQIKCDEGNAACLEDGCLSDVDDGTKVIKVDCELRVI